MPPQAMSLPPTALVAGVLAVSEGMRNGVIGLLLAVSGGDTYTSRHPELDPTGLVRKAHIVVQVIPWFGIGMLVGGILLLARIKFGRVLIGVGGFGYAVLSIGVTTVLWHHIKTQGSSFQVDYPVVEVTYIAALTTTTLVLTFLPSTARWLTSRIARPT